MNPWPDERVVVVTDDPTAVEAAVLQLEDWGASPAVMFERGRALRALHVQEPDLVVLDFGRSPEATHSLLVTLEEVQPILPGALHAAPLVVLAEGATAQRVERDAWAPLHVTPHDDPDRMRAALTAAHQDTTPFAPPAPPVLAAAVVGAAAPVAVASVATRRTSSIVPVAAALLIVGVSVWFAFQQGASGSPSAIDPTTIPLSTSSVAASATTPAAAPTLAAAVAPAATLAVTSPAIQPSATAPIAISAPFAASTIEPATAAPTPPSAATTVPASDASPAAIPIPSNSTTGLSDPASVPPAPTIARLPVTGSR